MLRSTTEVPTTRGERYRDQLASHGAAMLRQQQQRDHVGGPPIQDTTVTESSVVLNLAWGRCTITASDTALVLVAEAETQDGLAKIQTGVGRRLTKIGRRDGLTVTWSHAEEVATDDLDPRTAPKRHFGGLTTISVAALVGLILAVHLDIAAALLRQHWAWWALAVVAALIPLKLVVMRHAFGGFHGHRSQHR